MTSSNSPSQIDFGNKGLLKDPYIMFKLHIDSNTNFFSIENTYKKIRIKDIFNSNKKQFSYYFLYLVLFKYTRLIFAFIFSL